MRVVVAEGELLERISSATFSRRNRGLSRPAAATLEAALRKTAWAEQHHRRVALLEGSDVLASADRYAFTGTLDARPVSICGIGAVRPGPVHHNDRQARQLVEHLIEEAMEAGTDVVLMCLLPHERSYVPDGFVEIPTQDLELKVVESIRYGAPMTPLRVGEDRDLAAIVAMGEVRALPFTFHLDRSVDYVKYAITRARLRAGLAPSGDRQLRFLIAEEGITAAAYVVLSVAGPTWTIEECGDRDPSGARVGAILQALIAEEPAELRPSIRAWLPPGFLPPQVTQLSARPSEDILMMRVLRPAATGTGVSGGPALFWRSDVF